MSRRLSLDYLTVSGATPVEQVAAAAAAGFESVGLRFLAPSDLVIEHEVVDDPAAIRAIRAACASTGVRVLDVEVFFLGPRLSDERTARAADAAAEVGAATILAVIADDDRPAALDRFRRLADLAAANGMDVALEFVPWSAVPSLVDALAFVAAADRPNAGVCVDALHLSRSGGSPEQAAALPRTGSFVQLSDAPAVPPPLDGRKAEARGDRLYPGEGGLPLDRLVETIPADMPISIEVPSRATADRTVTERAAIAAEALSAFLARAARAREAITADSRRAT